MAAGTAAAVDVPAGFVAQPTLAAKVQTIAGRPLDVLCAQTQEAWDATAKQLSSIGGDSLAFVYPAGGQTIYLSPTACGPLAWPRFPRLDDRLHTLGAAVEVFTHEAEHVAGVVAEGDAECRALSVLPALMRARWIPAKLVTGPHRTARQRTRLAQLNSFARRNALLVLMRGAWDRHRAAVAYSSAYRGACG